MSSPCQRSRLREIRLIELGSSSIGVRNWSHQTAQPAKTRISMIDTKADWEIPSGWPDFMSSSSRIASGSNDISVLVGAGGPRFNKISLRQLCHAYNATPIEGRGGASSILVRLCAPWGDCAEGTGQCPVSTSMKLVDSALHPTETSSTFCCRKNRGRMSW